MGLDPLNFDSVFVVEVGQFEYHGHIVKQATMSSQVLAQSGEGDVARVNARLATWENDDECVSPRNHLYFFGDLRWKHRVVRTSIEYVAAVEIRECLYCCRMPVDQNRKQMRLSA